MFDERRRRQLKIPWKGKCQVMAYCCCFSQKARKHFVFIDFKQLYCSPHKLRKAYFKSSAIGPTTLYNSRFPECRSGAAGKTTTCWPCKAKWWQTMLSMFWRCTRKSCLEILFFHVPDGKFHPREAPHQMVQTESKESPSAQTARTGAGQPVKTFRNAFFCEENGWKMPNRSRELERRKFAVAEMFNWQTYAPR